MKNKNIDFYFDPKDGSSLCIIQTKSKTFLGSAQCSEQDKDMMNEKTGCEIAYHRAFINSLIDRREELKNELAGLRKYYYTVCQSKYFDKESYMAVMLQRQIQQREDDIKTTKDLISDEKKFLKEYMANKAEFYKRIRANRKLKEEFYKKIKPIEN